jgi:DNA-binding MarR family transcriptional regulator
MTTLSGSTDEPEPDHALSQQQVRVLALARAVAQKGNRARLLDSENRVCGWVSIERAVLMDVSFMVPIAPHVAAFDFDSPEELHHLPEALALLRQEGLDPVVVASGQEGRRHVFVRVPPARRRVLEQRLAQVAGGEVVRRDIRPPLAPHRLGLPVTLISPATVDDALALLHPVAGSERRLTPGTWRLLRHGDPHGRYKSRSEMEMAILTGMVVRGWSLERALKALLDPRNKGGAKAQETARGYGERAAKAQVARSYDKAVDFEQTRPSFRDRKEVVAALCSQRMRVEDALWPGARGQRLQQVLLAVLDLAVEQGSVYVQPGLRRLSEMVGMADNTVSSLLDTLVKEGWLRKHPAPRGRQTTYKVNTNKRPTQWSTLEALPTSPKGGCETSASELDPNHDAFQHRGGLGKPGFTLMKYLAEPHTISEMLSGTGLPKATVLRLLKTMKASSLVEQTDSNYQAVRGHKRTLFLGVHARKHGVLLAGQKRRASNQVDRERRKPTDSPVAATPAYGLLSPTTGDFLRLSRPQKAEDGPLGMGQVGSVILTIPVLDWHVTVMGGREVVWASTDDPGSRAFTAHSTSTHAHAAVQQRQQGLTSRHD